MSIVRLFYVYYGSLLLLLTFAFELCSLPSEAHRDWVSWFDGVFEESFSNPDIPLLMFTREHQSTWSRGDAKLLLQR